MSNNNSKVIGFFSIFVLAIFALAIIYLGVSIGMDVNKGKEVSSKFFSDVCEVSTYYINQFGFSDDFSTYFSEYLQKQEKIAALVITKDSSSVYAFPVSSNMISIDNFGEPVLNGNSPLVKVFSKNLQTFYAENITVAVAIYLTTPSTIVKYGRISFIVILVATILVFSVLFYYYLKYNRKFETSDNDDEVKSEENVAAENNERQNVFTDSLERNERPDIEEEPEKNIEQEDSSPSVQNNSEEEKTDETIENTATENSQENAKEYFIKENAYKKSFSDPQGLFSNKTGLGWESYFETRLDAELSRCASSQQDLSLFLIRIIDFPLGTEVSTEITDLLLSCFKFRDLVFEYGKDGYAAIVQDINLDTAMELCQSLYSDLSAILINKNIKNKIAMGISNRSVRLITGDKLIYEANQALNKAQTEEGLPIVAFRVDLQKYREIL